jgi:hypothetical protein
MTYTQEEPLILSVDLGLTTGLAIGRRMRTIESNKWRYALIWDSAAKANELYGILEQIKLEYSLDFVVVENPILSITNPYYHELKNLMEELGSLETFFKGIPVIEVRPTQWKCTPSIRFKSADNKLRTCHQYDAIRIGHWFTTFGYKKLALAIDKK